jgi:signal transduction histidine kinase
LNTPKSLKINIILLFFGLISIVFGLNLMVAVETMRGEKVADAHQALNHLLQESYEEYIHEPLSPHSDLTFLLTVPHNQRILRHSPIHHVQFFVSSRPISSPLYPIGTSLKLPQGLYLTALSDSTKVEESVDSYLYKLLLRYTFSLVVILGMSWILLEYYMKPLALLAQKIGEWNHGDPFEVVLAHPTREIKELSDAFGSLIRRLEGFRSKESVLFKEAAHELKTPLALMRSRLDVYTQGGYKKDQFIADIGQDIERLSSELKNVLFLESSDYEDPFTVDMSGALHTIVRKVDILAHQKQLRLALPTKSFTVMVPEKLLTKVLVALIDNAMTYAPKGGTINLEIDDKNRTLTIGNDSGEEKYLFSSKIGHKVLKRLSLELRFTYAITQTKSHYSITLHFL